MRVDNSRPHAGRVRHRRHHVDRHHPTTNVSSNSAIPAAGTPGSASAADRTERAAYLAARGERFVMHVELITLRRRRPRRWRTGVAAMAVGVAAAATVWTSMGTASAATLSATVTVNAGQNVATFPAGVVGANVAIWDGRLADPQTSTLLKNAAVSFVRYPGGSYGDIYHWQTHTAPGGYVAPNTSFDEYMTMVRSAGAQPIIIANYGSGTPQEAADWVRYANVTQGYGVKYWEIGNEVYGNGHYGANWETDNHADKSPRGYATNVLQYVSAMKAVDPTIKIGVVLTTPTYWPDWDRGLRVTAPTGTTR
jgi:hypothetical protein